MGRIGEFRERITIQTSSGGADAGGGKSTVFTDLVTIWAKVSPMSKRIVDNGRDRAGTSYEITMRFDSQSITNNQDFRIIFGTKTIKIHQIINVDERSKMVKILGWDG